MIEFLNEMMIYAYLGFEDLLWIVVLWKMAFSKTCSVICFHGSGWSLMSLQSPERELRTTSMVFVDFSFRESNENEALQNATQSEETWKYETLSGKFHF